MFYNREHELTKIKLTKEKREEPRVKGRQKVVRVLSLGSVSVIGFELLLFPSFSADCQQVAKI